MNVKFLKFYEYERDDERGIFKGSLHVQLSDFGIEIRGIYVNRDEKGKWFFVPPNRKCEDGSYLIFSFTDKEKGNQFMKIIREEGRTFIEKNLKESINQAKDRSISTDESKTVSNTETSENAKEMTEKPKPKQSAIWITPPPLKKPLNGRKK